jgi:diguanylate cyclase (GGDEF)-like protein
MMAQRFGEGDMTARAGRDHLPTEFVPLAKAFNAMAGQLARREHDLMASNDKLTVLASVDELSDLANRRGFDSRLTFEWLKGEQTGQALGLLMIDIDHFKLFNDTYGHLDGDGCLRKVSETLARIARQSSGFAARYGGEEFSVLLPGADAARTAEIGEAVRAAVEALAIPHNASAFGHVTVSIGVAAALPVNQQDPKDLVEAADASLYAAKWQGRNTVVEHGAPRGARPGIALAG